MAAVILEMNSSATTRVTKTRSAQLQTRPESITRDALMAPLLSHLNAQARPSGGAFAA